MSLSAYPLLARLPNIRYHHVKIQFNGAGAPVKVYGDGWTITRTGVGLYRATPSDRVGKVMDVKFTHSLNTPAAGAGLLMELDENSITTAGVFDFAIEDPGTEAAAPALVDPDNTNFCAMMIICGESPDLVK